MLILAAVIAVASQTASEPPVEWARRPPIEYPARALSRDVRRGHVRLSCRFEASIATECTIVEETPQGEGFGPEALRAVRRGVAAPGTEGVRAVRLDFVLG
ncbi:hypothetical protein ACO2Q1_15810 [Brevundimonas sp. VNH65]|uniref:hypothetical protein n=1 Tax=Brevundimonas sp. VNH65 TaxID=3400917 RepID=UPI003C058F6B